MTDDTLFEADRALPEAELHARTESLVGFDSRYTAVYNQLRLVLESSKLAEWSRKHHGSELPVCSRLADRHPLFIFAGDVGTGKTVTAEGIADRISRDLRKEARLLKLSARIRGKGRHGEMGVLVGKSFERIAEEAGKKRFAFLLIDEADAIASTRSTAQMHQEEKSGVNYLIQKLDDIRAFEGRVVVFLCTNRLKVLDPAIVRRAVLILKFERPNDTERETLIRQDLDGVVLSDDDVACLVEATGPKAGQPGMSFADMRLRWLPEAIGRAFPDNPLTADVLRDAAEATSPSPEVCNE